MYKFLFFLILIITSPYLVAADEKSETQNKTPEYTEEQLNKLKAAEEQFKDNPGMMKFINKIKEQTGVTKPPETKEVAPQKPAIQGSRSVADKAYENGDYETALEHYKALAEKGDTEASLVVGTMYQEGQGTEKDPALARAWYKIAADDEDDDGRGEDLMQMLDSDEISEDEKLRSEKAYVDIHNKIAFEDAAQKIESGQQPETIELIPPIVILDEETEAQLTDAILTGIREHAYYAATPARKLTVTSPENFDNPAKITLKKNSAPLHYRPVTNNERSQSWGVAKQEHYVPDKFFRK